MKLFRACFASLIVAATLGACSTVPSSESARSPSVDTIPAISADTSPLVALVDGDALDFARLRASLIEIAGENALKDAVLDMRLTTRLAREQLTISADAVARERALLLETLSTDESRAIELLGAIRLRQGLGDTRFEALLRRNAGLRALVARAIVIDESGLANAFDVAHGPRRTARVAVLSRLGDAERFSADVAAGRAFMELAVERSLDEGAARGGLLAPLARRDPSYPEALRAAIFATAIGAVSPPILDEARFYVVTVISEQPADGVTREASHEACEKALRLSRERLLMDALARERYLIVHLIAHSIARLRANASCLERTHARGRNW